MGVPGDDFQADELLRAFFDLAPIGKAIATADAVLLRVNDTLATMLGYDVDELQGLSLRTITHPDDLAESITAARVLLAGEQDSVALEKRYRVKDGGYLWTHVTTRLRRDAEGRPLHLLAYFLDISRQRKADGDLFASEARARRQFEAARDGILIVDASSGRILDGNLAMMALTSQAREALLACHLWELGLDGDAARLEAWFAECRKRDGARLDDVALKHGGGATVVVDLVSHHDLVDQIRVIQVNLHNVTDRKRAADELRTLSRAIEQSPASIVITDPAGHIEYVNPRFEEVTGYTSAEVVGQNPRILQSGTTPHATYVELWRVISAGGEWRGEMCNRRKGGELYWESAAISGIKDEAGRIVHYVAVKEDITERRAADEALRLSESLLLEAQRLASLGSYVLDVATGRWRSSVMLDEIFGIDADHPRTVEGWAALIHPDDRAMMEAHLANDVLAGSKPFDREYRIVRPGDQAERWVHGLGTVRRDAHGQPLRMHGTIQDITARKESARARADLEARFQQAQKMESVGRLAGGVAHDFNNLLSVIVSYAELIWADLKPDEPVRADIDEIRTAARRATDLTRQLLAFSRSQVLDPKVLNLNTIVAGMEKMLGRLLGADIDLTILAARDLGNIHADPGQVEQVVMNLAVNARDAMGRGGKLTLETANVILDDDHARSRPGVHAGAYVELAVTDTGTGMDPETQAKIFEPFFTTKEQGKGTGLGLATVYGIIKQSGGDISVRSEPGLGTTFKVYLPRVSTAVDAPGPEWSESTLPRGSGTILLVEDDDQVRVLARNILRRHGYVVLEAANAGEALLICEQHGASIDLLLTDVVMPRMSGRQLAERLAPMRPAMRVLYMSGYTDDAILRHGVFDSGVPFLQKPLTPASLTQKVYAVLHGDPARP